MNKNYLKNKAGVSLITVLLFMLVATIAATATWKYLSSEGFSSASRMLKNEAKQSAQAGIENARSWMTFHANDVGALIRQYQDNNGKPINLDNQLRTLQRAGQNYHVWLIGVNTQNSTYKLKILSSGEARNNTHHTETAIFNVDGLYRVKIPVTQSSINFAEAFHGGVKTYSELLVDRAVITQTPEVKNGGGQGLNKLTVTDYLIMDGSFYANSENKINKLYVTGDAGTCTGINIDSNIYVGGTFYPGEKSIIKGSLYTEGGINLKDFYSQTALTGGCGDSDDPKPGDAEIWGNITSNGPFTYYDRHTSRNFLGKKSMVVNSYIQFPQTYWRGSTWETDKVQIKHNVYVKDDNLGYMGCTTANCDGRDAVPRTLFGSGDGDEIWLKGFVYYSGTTPFVLGNTSTKCEIDGYTCARSEGFKKWIGFKGEFLNSEPSADHMSSWNADRMEEYAEKLADTADCGRVKTPIQLNHKIFTLGLTHSKNDTKGCSAGIWTPWQDNTPVLMNECYKTAQAKNNLYNGDWLILEFDEGTTYWFPNVMGATELSGNFIFKINAPSSNIPYQLVLPPTTADSKVLLYLPDGWPAGTGSNIEFANGNKQHRYFVFSEGDVTRFDMLNLKSPMSGSIVMAKCSEFNTKGNNVGIRAYFDQDLTDALADASIICENDDQDECSAIANSSSSTGSSDSNDDSVYDRYYISMAPQLGISLESQNRSFEDVSALQKANGSKNLDSSFMILPRVISLPSDPYGRLIDYINVITLNKSQSSAALTKDKLSIDGSCTKVGGSATLNIASITSKLYTPGEDKLKKGSYKCNIKADGFTNTIPIWIVVDNKEMRSLHQISFKEASQEIGSSQTRDVYVRLQPQIPNINLNVSCPNAPSNWEYDDVRDDVTTGGTCTFAVSNTGNTETEIRLFSIKTTSATNGTMNFQILEGDNYIATEPTITTIYMSTTASLYRSQASYDQVNSYCSSHESDCPTESELLYWPNCEINDNEKWVEPNGAGFKTESTNDSWLITTEGNTTVSLRSAYSGNCTVVIPDTSCTFTDDNKTCTLPASIKAKVHKVKFKFKNVDSDTDPFFTVTNGIEAKICTYSDNSEHECIVNVYGENQISAIIDTTSDANKDFRYWQCSGASCPYTAPLSSTIYPPFSVSDNETIITVAFNEVDRHCFFDKFEMTAATCENLSSSEKKEYCIDHCATKENCESAISTGNFADAKWHLIDGNINMIDYSNGKISVKQNGDITVMSTINASSGTHGTLKALVRLPKNISGSGFLVGSNADATSYLKINTYIDDNGFVRAKVCNETGLLCKEGAFSISVTEDDMVMIEVEITAQYISIMASKGNERSNKLAKLDLNYWNGSYQGSYVGFHIASPKFMIYGVGWKSTNYECFNTFPTIKCSFAAITHNGVVPRGEYVKPWVGYSGWRGWNTDDCTEKYYYIGDDACGANSYGYAECSNDGFYFDITSSGKHGYTDANGNDIRTAKVGLDCNNSTSSDNTEETLWASDSAHCGVFWTGPQNACTATARINNEVTLVASDKQSLAFDNTVNMRSAQIRIETSNPDSSEIWIWLISEGEGSEQYSSKYVTMIDSSKTFDIEDFTTESSGFDPGKVKSIYFENKGNNTVKIKNIASICGTAIRVNSCSVEKKTKTTSYLIWWNKATVEYYEITASVNNKDGVEQYHVITQHNSETPKSYSISKNYARTNDNNVTIALPKGVGYTEGAFNNIKFTMSVSADGIDSDTVECTKIASDPPLCIIEKPTTETTQEAVHFKAKLTNCENCEYAVTLDNATVKSGTCSKKTCDISIPHPELESITAGEHTFILSSTETETRFDACEQTFTVTKTATPENVTVTCPSDITNQDPEGVIPVTNASVQNCTDCSFKILSGGITKTSGTDINNLAFSDPSASSPTTYTLQAQNASGTTGSCTFKVTFSSSSSSGSTTTEEFSYNDEYTFKPNTTYTIKCYPQDGSQRQLVCMTTDGSTISYTYGGATVTANPGYWSGVTCSSSLTTLTTPQTIKCKYMW